MSSVSEIKSVVFDFGGVIIDLFPDRTSNRLYEYIDNSDRDKVLALALEVELGRISGDEFLESLGLLAKKNVSTSELEKIWNLMLGDIDRDKVIFMKELQSKYDIFLLSNTNIVHKNFFDKICFDAFGMSSEDFFKATFYSHEINMRKPNSDIFSHVIKEIRMEAHNILFVDDLESNTETAKDLGMQVFDFKRNASFDCLNFLKV